MYDLAARMDRLRDAKEGALIVFLMAGFPNEKRSLDCLAAVQEGGCDVLELGVPFSDPLADGEIIESMHHECVRNGFCLTHVLDLLDRASSLLSVPVVLCSYFNPIFRRGISRTMRELKDVGVKGIMVPDLPLEELGRVRGYGLDVIPMASPSTASERLAMIEEQSPAFVYCVSSPGVTGTRTLPDKEIKRYLDGVRKEVTRPLALGFGIASSKDVAQFRDHADACVVGSCLARLMQDHRHDSRLPDLLEKEVSSLKAATRPGGRC